MIYEKYSVQEFAKLGFDSEAAKARTEQLERELLEEVRPSIENCLAEVVEQLNSLGHDLRLEEKDLGVVSYRDDYGDGADYECRLRIALDYVASSGYSHLLNGDDELINAGEAA